MNKTYGSPLDFYEKVPDNALPLGVWIPSEQELRSEIDRHYLFCVPRPSEPPAWAYAVAAAAVCLLAGYLIGRYFSRRKI